MNNHGVVNFYPHDAICRLQSAVSACPSVRLSRPVIVLKRVNLL